MGIRLAGESEKIDKDMVIAMWKSCFDDDSDDFVKWYFERIYKPENTLVLFDNKKPASSMQMLQKKVCLNKEIITMPYLVGVCTYLEYRGKGYAKKLLKESLERMKAKGRALCMLLPFKSQFYRNLGWETCYFHYKYQLNRNDITQMLENYKHIESGYIRPIDFEKDIDKLIAVYNRFTIDKNGYIVRAESEWQDIVTDLRFEGCEGVFIEYQGIPVGYLIYSIETTNKNTDIEGKLYSIDEIAYVNYKALLGMLKYLKDSKINLILNKERLTEDSLSTDDNIMFRITTSTDNNLYMYLPEQTAKLSISPFMMVRIVDISSLIPLISKIIIVNSSIVIKIIDEFAEWNNCNLIITHTGKPQIDYSSSAPADISCPINIFSQLIFATITIEQAKNEGLITVNNEKMKDDLSAYIDIKRTGTNFTNDHF